MIDSRAADTISASAEWRAYWPLVLACFMGMSVQPATYYALGLFIDPLTTEFGWSRTTISAGASVAALIHIPTAPLVGAMIDRWGVRRVAVPGTVACALSICAFSLANGSASQWIALWVVYAFTSIALKSTVWTKAISGRFETTRSFALSVGLSGSALAIAIVPPLARWLVDTYGWREAWVMLGAGIGITTFIPCALFLFDYHDDARKAVRSREADKAGAITDLPGLSVAQAIRSLALWRIGFATLIILTLTSALTLHKVPMLVEAGLSRTSAAWLTSLSGIAGFSGSFIVGWLMDRYDAGRIGAITNALGGLALIFLLRQFRTPELIVASMLVIGFAGGAKLQLCAYMTGRYGGLRNFGKIFGVMAGIIATSGGMASAVGGLAYDYAGSYDLLIIAGIPLSLVSAMLIVGLGPYPVWSTTVAKG